MIFSRQARRDNSEDTGMPVARAHHDGSVAGRIETLRQRFLRFGEDLFLDGLPLPVLRIQKDDREDPECHGDHPVRLGNADDLDP